jgi:glycosyltransferase involved in cell wall biosynthesis
MGDLLTVAQRATAGRPVAAPMRIARIIARLNVGGPAQHAIFLSAGLDPARFDTTLITGTVGPHEGDLTAEARARGVTPVVIPELGRRIHLARDLVALGKLVTLLRRLRPDLVHTHTAKAGALGRVAALLTGVPAVVHTFHGHVLEGYFSPTLTRLFLQIERALARITDRIITVSPQVRQDLLARGVGRPEQVEVIPVGLDLARFLRGAASPARLRDTLAIPAGAPLLGIVGRLVAIKDHPTLFQALALLQSQGPSPHLIVVGDGERREALTRMAQDLGLAPRIHFLGWRNDLEAILGELDVVICCSKNEGTPVALIEAMAAGVPVLSAEVGGVGDLIRQGETGWLAPPGDPPALSRAIRDLLADPERRARPLPAARRLALERHDVKGLLHRMEALYEALLAEKQLKISN